MYRPHSRAHNFDIKIALYVKKIKIIIVKHKGDANICEREESSIHILIVTHECTNKSYKLNMLEDCLSNFRPDTRPRGPG